MLPQIYNKYLRNKIIFLPEKGLKKLVVLLALENAILTTSNVFFERRENWRTTIKLSLGVNVLL